MNMPTDPQARKAWRRKLLRTFIIVVSIASLLPIALLYSGYERQTQRYDNCKRDQRAYDTLHKLIAKTGEPTTEPSTVLVLIPSLGPAPQSVTILPPPKGTPPADLSGYFTILDGRPSCAPPGVF